jgi:hypothetical protein
MVMGIPLLPYLAMSVVANACPERVLLKLQYEEVSTENNDSRSRSSSNGILGAGSEVKYQTGSWKLTKTATKPSRHFSCGTFCTICYNWIKHKH